MTAGFPLAFAVWCGLVMLVCRVSCAGLECFTSALRNKAQLNVYNI
jgi:hypothetical protein